jgi:hypothetical protein
MDGAGRTRRSRGRIRAFAGAGTNDDQDRREFEIDKNSRREFKRQTDEKGERP